MVDDPNVESAMKRFPKQLAKFQRPQRGRGFALFNRNANTG
jgi:hypothetical protein